MRREAGHDGDDRGAAAAKRQLRARVEQLDVEVPATLFRPGYQLWMGLDVSREGFAGGRWSVASASVAEIRAGVTAMNVDVATTVAAVLAAGAAISPAWPGLGLIRVRSIRADSEAAQDTGITLPRVVTEAKPLYTRAAMQPRVQGTVWLTVVVLACG